MRIIPDFSRWDNGYPSGGNYWSDYTGTDNYSGPSQNIPGSDGIGDVNYTIDANNAFNSLYLGFFHEPQFLRGNVWLYGILLSIPSTWDFSMNLH
jgi:hypothetical protein